MCIPRDIKILIVSICTGHMCHLFTYFTCYTMKTHQNHSLEPNQRQTIKYT